MRSLSPTCLLLCCSVASAFPALSPDAAAIVARLANAESQAAPLEERQAIAFDPKAQLVDVTGVHAFKAPNLAAGDQRGPCPGLNALAYVKHCFV